MHPPGRAALADGMVVLEGVRAGHGPVPRPIAVVVVELGVISWIRNRYMDTPAWSAALQVGFGGLLVFVTGILIGSS